VLFALTSSGARRRTHALGPKLLIAFFIGLVLINASCFTSQQGPAEPWTLVVGSDGNAVYSGFPRGPHGQGAAKRCRRR